MEAGTSGGAALPRLNNSPDSRLAMIMTLRTSVRRSRAELEDFMEVPLSCPTMFPADDVQDQKFSNAE